ncbi:MAG TPA: Stp1/IreP family PP2C-type Ser/Thr phosphatase [Gaiellaceae bacterium]|nr:Stp1/IreP family PP2C-type Ser/Thr phosphatase [Gaiellaceae bacterium]
MRIGRAYGVTDTGRRRLRNEDAFICEPPLFAVADGMGGARAGEVAARLAAAALEEAGTETRGEQGVTALIVEANRRIWERALTDPATAGMGTTVTAALVDARSGTVAVGHVGDSRAYLLRDGALEQLTTDHSLVAELVQSGVLTPEEAERHPQRSAITRALGTEPSVDVETRTVEARPGDIYLVCSDGVPVMLTDEDIFAAIDGSGRDPAAAAEALVAAANARGGEDNITVVLFELVEGEAPVEETAVTEAVSEPTGPTPETADPGIEVGHHGAGPGGRAAALLLVAAVLVIGAIVLYWGVTR